MSVPVPPARSSVILPAFPLHSLTLLTQQHVDVRGDAQGTVGNVLQKRGFAFAGEQEP